MSDDPCSEMILRLTAVAAGETDDEAERHATGCVRCRAELSELRRAIGEARRVGGARKELPETFWTDFSRTVRVAYHDEPAPRRSIRGWILGGLLFAGAAASLFALSTTRARHATSGVAKTGAPTAPAAPPAAPHHAHVALPEILETVDDLTDDQADDVLAAFAADDTDHAATSAADADDSDDASLASSGGYDLIEDLSSDELARVQAALVKKGV